MQFILVKDDGDTGSQVDQAEFMKLVGEFVGSGVDASLASKSRLSLKKLGRAEIMAILDAALPKAVSVVDKIAKVRVKP